MNQPRTCRRAQAMATSFISSMIHVHCLSAVVVPSNEGPKFPVLGPHAGISLQSKQDHTDDESSVSQLSRTQGELCCVPNHSIRPQWQQAPKVKFDEIPYTQTQLQIRFSTTPTCRKPCAENCGNVSVSTLRDVLVEVAKLAGRCRSPD